MKRRRSLLRWDSWLRALVLVRLGQELGSASPTATAIRDAIDAVLALVP